MTATLIVIAGLLMAILCALVFLTIAVISTRNMLMNRWTRLRKQFDILAASHDRIVRAYDNSASLFQEATTALVAISKHQLESNETIKSSLSWISDSMGQISKASERLSVFATGTEKIALASVEAVTRLEASVTEYTRLSFGIDSGKQRGQSFDDVAQNLEVEALVREQGMSRQEAQETVRRDRTYNFAG